MPFLPIGQVYTKGCYVCLSIYLSVCLSVHTSVSRPISLFVSLNINQYIFSPYFHLYVHWYICQSIHPYVCLSGQSYNHISIHYMLPYILTLQLSQAWTCREFCQIGHFQIGCMFRHAIDAVIHVIFRDGTYSWLSPSPMGEYQYPLPQGTDYHTWLSRSIPTFSHREIIIVIFFFVVSFSLLLPLCLRQLCTLVHLPLVKLLQWIPPLWV